MSEISAAGDGPKPNSRLKRLLPVALPLLALGAGLGTTYAGLWSPLALAGLGAPASEHVEAAPAATFVDVPRIVLTLPGERPRTLAASIMLEVAPGTKEQAVQLMPRIVDSFNSFLADIDPAAFQRRGILEIVRIEMATRARFVLGEKGLRDLLITEFRVQ